MNISNILYSLPNPILFVLIFILLLIFSAACMYLIENFVPSQLRYKDNNAIGYVGATIGVIYAVLAGFIIFYVMDNFQKASDITRMEAASAAAIYRNSMQLPVPINRNIQTAVENYVETVINIEWPLFARDKTTNAGEAILDKMVLELNAYKAKNNQDLFALHDIDQELDQLYKNRDERFDLSSAALPGDLWILVIISTLLTLFVKAMSGMKLRLHVVMQIVVTLMLTAILFLIIVLDRPFRGHFSIKPLPFEDVLIEINKKNKT